MTELLIELSDTSLRVGNKLGKRARDAGFLSSLELRLKAGNRNAGRRFILAWVSGLIWSEVKQLWDVGLEEYVNDMWNVIDFVTNSLYVATVALRIVAYYRVQKENEDLAPGSVELQREQWDTWDPMLISEGLFSAANIFR